MGCQEKVYVTLAVVEVVVIVLFFVFGRYEGHNNYEKYPMFQDVHVMIFVGFGFLMTFLKRYGFSSLGFTLLLASFIIQWSLICEGLYDLDDGYEIELGIESLYNADIAAAAFLISMGVILGRASITQLIIMGVIEMIVYNGNLALGRKILKVSDAGASIFVHTFGAYFGLAVSFVLNRKKDSAPESTVTGASLQESNYTSDMFAMIGTIFLWLYWPSFNAIDLVGQQQLRAVVNTYLSLTACTVTTFAVSVLLTKEKKFDMVHVQNSTLAGGVAVGASCNMMLSPGGALLVGTTAGVLSVVGYAKITPAIERYLKIPDTCGVHNLHGMPGVLAGIVSAILAGMATQEAYGDDFYNIFPARLMVTSNSTDALHGPSLGRHAASQAWYQIIALISTICLSTVSGLIAGFIMRAQCGISSPNHYDDALYWKMPEDEPVETIVVPQIAFDKKASIHSNLSNFSNVSVIGSTHTNGSHINPTFDIGASEGAEQHHLENR